MPRLAAAPGLAIDITLPRAADFHRAVRYRDLTINSIGLQLTDGQIIDPLQGRQDLERRLLRACDARRFGDDPLRGLRVAQIMARLNMRPEAALTALCRGLDLSHVAAERIFGEIVKLLLQTATPSVGLVWLAQARLLHALVGLDAAPIDARHLGQPIQADRLIDASRRIDQAAARRDGGSDGLALMWGALLSAISRAASNSAVARRGRASKQKGLRAEPLIPQVLEALKAPRQLIRRVNALVRYAQIPARLQAVRAPDSAYRQLCRALYRRQVSPSLLARLAQALQAADASLLAPHSIDAQRDAFVARLARLRLLHRAPTDVVQARDLLNAGLPPGPLVGLILTACRQRQDLSGSTDPTAIIKHVSKYFPQLRILCAKA